MMQIESLENRMFLSATAMDRPLLMALADGADGSRIRRRAPFNPNTGAAASSPQIRASLERLYKEGWRGLVTYSMDGAVQVPKLAKSVGFKKVIAGVYWYDNAGLQRERKAAITQRRYIDGYVVGNEGLGTRYSKDQLIAEIALRKPKLRQACGRDGSGCELSGRSLAHAGWRLGLPEYSAVVRDAQCAGRGEIHDGSIWPADLSPGREIIIKESWWPTARRPGASISSQIAYFKQLSKTKIDFIWGEAYDQFWKG